MNPRQWNWRLWVGFAVSLLALTVYVLVFENTRSILWLSIALCLVAIALLIAGLRRAFAHPESYRGKVAGPILTVLSVLVIAMFGFFSYEVPKGYATAHNAPRVGQKAPEFMLADSTGNNVALNQLLGTSAPGGSGAAHASRGVLLVFYRGYW